MKRAGGPLQTKFHSSPRNTSTEPTSSPTKTAPFHLHLISFIHSSPAGYLPTSNLIWHINTLASTRLEGEKKNNLDLQVASGEVLYLHSLDAQTARWMISRRAINPRLSIWCIYYVGKVPYIGILYTDERRGMLDGYLTTGMAKWYVQYTVHEMDAQADGGGKFFIFVALRKTMYACVDAIALASKQLKMRAAAEVL